MYSRCLFRTAILFTLLCCISAHDVYAGHMTLKKALSRKFVTLNAISNGGYCEKSIKLQLTNNTDKELTIDVDPGLIFVPADTAYQNLVLLGSESFALAPSKNTEVDLQTFCGKSYAACPAKNIKYRFWKQGDSNMVKVLGYARNHNVATYIVQRAVWMFTNGYAISTIYDDMHPKMSEDFVGYIAKLMRIPVPKFFMKFDLHQRPGRAVVDRDPRIYVTLHWGHDGYRQMYLDIYKENGDFYRRIEADRIIDKNGYTVQVQMDPRQDPNGTYTIKLHDNANKTWDEKKVTLGIDPHQVPGY